MDRVDVLATVGYNGTLTSFFMHTQLSYHIGLISWFAIPLLFI